VLRHYDDDFGNPAFLVIKIRGFASPNYLGFAILNTIFDIYHLYSN